MSNKYAAALREMADKLEKNEEADISGAFIVMPPVGEPISGILLGAPDIGGFFGLLKNKLDMTVIKLDEDDKKRRQGMRV